MLENAECERINFSSRSADSVGVVFDNEQDRQFSFFGKTDRFEEITLAGGSIAHRRNDDIFFAVQLDAPRHSTTGKKLGTGRCWHAPNAALDVAVVRRHHSAAAASLAFGKIFQRQLSGGHSAAQHKAPV